MTDKPTPADPARYEVVVNRNVHGRVMRIRVRESRVCGGALPLVDPQGEDEVSRLIALARAEDDTDPHDDALPSDRGFIRAALRDLGIPILGEEEDAPPPAAPATLPMEAALVPTRPDAVGELIAAAGIAAGLIEMTIPAHIYDFDNGDVQPADCPYALCLARLRAAIAAVAAGR